MHTVRRIAAGIIVLAASGAWVGEAGALTAQAGGNHAAPAPLTSETGASLAPVGAYRPPAAARATIAAKLKMLDNLTHGRPQMLGVSLSGTAGLASFAPGARAKPHSLPPTNGYGLKIFYEGQGNGNKTYTCGPSATRNMIYNFLGIDYGEHQFELWEGTSSSYGTNINSIASTLNTHFGSHGYWTTLAPSSASQLGNAINADADAGQEEIQNVQTRYLPFWGNHITAHFDNAYVYAGGDIYVAEEWDPPAIGLSEPYGNPFGFHAAPASSDYYAVHYSPSGRIVY